MVPPASPSSAPPAGAEVRHVGKRLVVAINRLCIELSGGIAIGPDNIRDGQSLGFVERIRSNSLFGRPIYPDLHSQAAAYLHNIVRNHVFHDGNKRTALACALTFLEWNGVVFEALDEDHVFDFVVSLASGGGDVPQIADWLRSISRGGPRSGPGRTPAAP